MNKLNLYKEVIMDHYRSPRHKGRLDTPDRVSEGANPSCGDAVSFDISIRDGIITDIRFQGVGCVLSLAAASMLAELVLHKKCEEVKLFQKEIMLDLLGIPLGPTRVRCALLPLETLQRIC